MRFKGKTAIVTGAAQGIGRAIALGFGREGANVVVGDIDGGRAEVVLNELKTGGSEALAVQVDVSSESSAAGLKELAIGRFGRIDVLVNNAGVYPVSPVLEIREEEWNRVVDTNLGGCFLCSRAVVPYMRSQKSGRIICVSSILGHKGAKNGAHYAASKAGIVGFVKALARELASDGVTVNGICPGVTDTAQPRGHRSEEELYAQGRMIPLGRIGQPQDIVGPTLFLASDAASYITGQVIVVDGGAYML